MAKGNRTERSKQGRKRTPPPENAPLWAKKVYVLVESSGLTDEEYAASLGLAHDTVSSWYKAKKEPSTRDIYAMCFKHKLTLGWWNETDLGKETAPSADNSPTLRSAQSEGDAFFEWLRTEQAKSRLREVFGKNAKAEAIRDVLVDVVQSAVSSHANVKRLRDELEQQWQSIQKITDSEDEIIGRLVVLLHEVLSSPP